MDKLGNRTGAGWTNSRQGPGHAHPLQQALKSHFVPLTGCGNCCCHPGLLQLSLPSHCPQLSQVQGEDGSRRDPLWNSSSAFSFCTPFPCTPGPTPQAEGAGTGIDDRGLKSAVSKRFWPAKRWWQPLPGSSQLCRKILVSLPQEEFSPSCLGWAHGSVWWWEGTLEFGALGGESPFQHPSPSLGQGRGTKHKTKSWEQAQHGRGGLRGGGCPTQVGPLARRAFIPLVVPSQSQDIHRSGVLSQGYLRMSQIVFRRCPSSPRPLKGRVSAGSAGGAV